MMSSSHPRSAYQDRTDAYDRILDAICAGTAPEDVLPPGESVWGTTLASGHQRHIAGLVARGHDIDAVFRSPFYDNVEQGTAVYHLADGTQPHLLRAFIAVGADVERGSTRCTPLGKVLNVWFEYGNMATRLRPNLVALIRGGAKPLPALQIPVLTHSPEHLDRVLLILSDGYETARRTPRAHERMAPGLVEAMTAAGPVATWAARELAHLAPTR